MQRRTLLSRLLGIVVLPIMVAVLASIVIKTNGFDAPEQLSATLYELRDAQEAEQVVQRAWLLAQQSGVYDFRTEIEQATYHAPALTNVGRPAQVESLYLEGKTDTRAKEFELAMWQGSSILHRDQAYEIRTDGQETYGRPAGGVWRPIDDVTSVFAPSRDVLAYLHGIRNVREVSPDSSEVMSSLGNGFRQFRFEMDGPAFAEYMRRQLEDELRSAGKLPAGITLDTPHIYRGIIGQGEIWLTSEGLPQQLQVNIHFPQSIDGSRVRAAIQTNFANFDTEQLARLGAPLGAVLGSTPLWLANEISRVSLVDWQAVGMQLGFLAVLACLVLLMVRFRRKPQLIVALNLAIIMTMVVAPLIQNAQVAAFQDEQTVAQQAHAADQSAQTQQRLAASTHWDPTQSPLEVAETAAVLEGRLSHSPMNVTNGMVAQNPSTSTTDSDGDGVPDGTEPPNCVGQTDCDGDGLTDLQETHLGTRLDNPDTDGDKLRDDLEVKGFAAGGQRWYLDARNVDTNGDGFPDTLECWREDSAPDLSRPSSQSCNSDSDGDGVPDLFTFDNDGDGVDDSVDLSPFYVTAASAPYNNDNPFTLQSNSLTPDEPLFVDMQLVPTAKNQISYARNVLDWPQNDTKGQVVRTGETTFATGLPANSYPASEENGDLRLIPLVEIKMAATDAARILPVTSTFSVTRQGVGTQASQTWLNASVTFQAADGTTTLEFANLTDKDGAAVAVDKVRIVASTCPTTGSGLTPVTERATTNQGEAWTLAGTPLSTLMDGSHALLLQKGSNTLCIPLGDLPSGGLASGQTFDTAWLDTYGISLRDVVDGRGQTTHVIAYLPANVVTGQTGGEKQAFGVRMAYWPGAGVTSLGTAQEVRLVWMVQLLADDGSTQIVHVYPNEAWRMAGLSARQDIEMHSAVIYQEPDATANRDADMQAIHGRLWSAIWMLDKDFARGGDNRLLLDDSLISSLESKTSAPAGSMGATLTTYQTQDELARVPGEVTPDILARFIQDGAYKPGYDHALLLFARQEEYKSADWDGGSTLTLPSASTTLTSYSWKPFRYTGGQWESFPATDYLDLLSVRLKDAAEQADFVESTSDPAQRSAIRDGIALVNQTFAMSMLYGANRMVAVDNSPLPAPAQENELADTLGTINEKIVGATLQIIAGEIAEDFSDGLISATATRRVVDNFEFASEEVLTAVDQRTKLAILGEVAQGRFDKFKSAFGQADLGTRVAVAGLAISVVSIGLVIGKLVSSNSTLSGAIDVSMPALGVVAGTLTVASEANNVINAAKGASGLTNAIKSAQPLSRAAKIAAVVGLVLSVAIAVGVFVTQWVAGAFSITDLGFTAALSGVIAAIIVAVILLAISAIPIVGPIIVAVIALIDGLIAAACAITKKAGFDLEAATTLEIPRTGGAKLSLCAGITGLATEAIRFLLFSQTVLVGNMQAQDRLTTSNFDLNLADQEAGFQVGNSFNPSLRVDNKITLPDQPFDWKSLAYFWQFNWDNLDSATHRYDLTTDKSDRSVSREEMEGEWRELNADGSLTASHRSPGLHYDDPLVMVSTVANLSNAQASVPLTQTGINVSIPLYLREAYANPAQECWAVPSPIYPVFPIPICLIRSDKGTNHIDLGLHYDIFPATLDEFYFYAPAAVGDAGGVSLAWGQEGDITFPVMRDFDGDGLLSPAVGGNDVDDRFWDADGDGLSDLFETQNGTMPGAADSDQDGLSDRTEQMVGTDPLRADSDGDGLLDGEEVFHEDDQGNWVGGWEFIYDMVAGVPQSTWVTSDPLSGNGDRDTFTDYQERLYGLNPRAVSDPTILKLKTQLTRPDAPGVLLRFEERNGSTVVADSTGLGNNASCSGDACPQAGHEGRFTNGLVFDGVDDVLRMPQAVPLGDHSFTVAIWARRNTIGRPDLLFNTQEGDRGEQMWMGFGATNQFACGFTPRSALASPAYTDTDWHHWACTYDLTLPTVVGEVGSVTATLYRDGEVVEQGTFSRALGYFGSGDWLIGGSYDQSGNFNSFGGTLDEFVVIPAALTQAQIRLLMQAQYNVGSDRLLVAPGDRLAYEADLENNLLGRTLTGLLSVNAPTGWINNENLVTYQLSPTQTQALNGNLTVSESAATGAYSVTVTAGADARLPDAPQASAPSAADVHFSFDDAQNQMIDASGRQINTRVGGASRTAGVGVGDGLQLNGATLLDIPDDAAVFDLSNTPFTWSVWVKPDAGAGSTRGIFGQPPRGREWSYNSAGVYLRVQNDTDLIFGWGEAWNTDRIPNVFTPASWNHVAVTYDQRTLTIYVNGVQQDFFTPNSAPTSISRVIIGDDNYCGQFELKNVRTKEEGDPGEASAEYVYRFEDEQGNKDTLLNDENADTGDWEPGSGPSNNEWFTDKTRTFCRSGSRVYVYEDDGALGSDDSMSPDVKFDIATPQKVGYNNSNYQSFWSPDIKGDGTVEFYYEIRNPVLPFKGGMDELRLYRRALNEEEVQQLFQVAAVPYHYTLDDPPGTGQSDFSGPGVTFTNEGAVADPDIRVTCSGSCPTSGLPGRVNRAASFGYIASDGIQIGQGIHIDNLSLPQAAPGFSLWVKPKSAGVFFSIYKDQNALIGSLFYSPENRFCLADGRSNAAPSCTSSVYPTDGWTHVMVNFSGSTMTLHLNNREQVNVQTSGPAWPGAGNYGVGLVGTNFMGLLDDLRIPYNGSNVAAMMATAPLVSLHLDEEGANITAWDNSGGSDATCSGSTCPDAGRRGKVAQAAAFDGVDDGLILSDSSELDLDHFTLAAWVSPASGNGAPIIAKSDGDFRNYAIYLTAERKIYLTRHCTEAGLLELFSQATLPFDQFTHVAATYDGAHLSLYINGVRDSVKQVTSANACHNDAPLAIGAPHNSSAYRHFNGVLDEVLIYPDALWDYEIRDLYTAQANWIEEKNAHTIFVDADLPTSTLAETLPLPTNHYPNADVQLGVNAADAGSDVILLELGVSVNGGPVTWTGAEPCQDAAQGESSPAWCPWFLPSQWGREGRYTLQTRATDAVGHRESPTASYAIVVDGTGPVLTVNQGDGTLLNLAPHPQIETAQILRLDGTVSDPAIGADAGSGVAQVWVTLRDAAGDPVGDAPYPATLNGGNWSLAYPFRQAQVAGSYRLDLSAEDALGNRTTLPTRSLALDGARPGMTLNEAASGLPLSQNDFRLITTTTVLQGWLADHPLPPGARYAYRFEETTEVVNGERTTFDNLLATSGTESAAWCVENNWGCPTLGTEGKDGRGLTFDGLYDFLSLPEDVAQTRDFTFAAWVYLDGPYPNRNQPIFYTTKDWQNYLYLTPVGSSGGPEIFMMKDDGQTYESLRTNDPLPAEQWTHLAFSIAGGVGRIYVNGVEQPGTVWINAVDQGNSRFTITPQDVAGETNWIGRRSASTTDGTFDGLSGKLDQVVIYRRGLSGDEIRTLAADRASGVASGSVSFTPLWAAEESSMISPHFSPELPGQTLYLPLDEASLSHPISATTTLYRNLDGGNAAGAIGQQPACTGDHCPRPAGNSPVGAAINFDGQDDFIQLPENLLQGDSFTFSAWVYWRGGESSQRIFSFGQDGSNGAELWAAGSEIYFSLNTQGNRESLTALTGLPTDRWVHVAVTLEGASSRLYLDGVEQGAKDDFASRLSQIAGNNNRLGNSNAGPDYYFSGMMSDVRVFSQALTVWDIKGLSMGNGALLALPMDEQLAVDGSSLADASDWGWTATLHSGPDDAANKAVPGHQGARALEFDGVDDYVALPAEIGNRYIGGNAAFTFASWVYWRGGAVDENNFSQPQYLLSLGEDVVASVDLSLTGQGLSFSVGSGGGDDPFSSRDRMQTNTPLPTDQWVHVAVTVKPAPVDYEPSSIFGVNGRSVGHIYINGVEQGNATLGYTPSSIVGMSNSFLGRSQEAGFAHFNGALDDVRVYPRALSQAELQDLARSGQQSVTLGDNSTWTLDMPTGLEGIYRLDLLGVDQGGRTGYNPTQPATNQTIDTLAPRVSLTSQTADQGMSTEYLFHASDIYLSDAQVITPCGAEGQVQKTYRWDSNAPDNKLLAELTVSCRLTEPPAVQTGSICDTAGNCAAAEITTLPAEASSQGVAPEQLRDTVVSPASPMHASSLKLISYTPSSIQPTEGLLLISHAQPSGRVVASVVDIPVSQEGSAGEASAADDLDSGLILHWDFEEGPDTCTVADRSPNGLSGSLTNMDCTEARRTDTPRDEGYSLYLGGSQTGEYLTSAASEKLPSGEAPRSLCFWAKSTDGTVNDWADHVVNYGSASASQAFGAMLYTGNTWYAYSHATDLNTKIPGDTEWHHHCVVYDGSALTYYLDGQSVASATAALNTAPDTAMVVGVRPDLDSQTSFDGWIDDVRLYGRALGGDEVQQVYTPSAPPESEYPPNTFRFIDLPNQIDSVETPIDMKLIAAPANGLTNLLVEIDGPEIDGTTLFDESYEGSGVPQRQVNLSWSPPAEGVYHLIARATDAVNGTVVISRTLFVDTTPPSSSLDQNTFTTQGYTWGGNLVFTGEVSDATGVISATATLELNGTRTALPLSLNPDAEPVGYLQGNPVYSSAPWRGIWRPSVVGDPLDYTGAVLELTVYDASLNPSVIQQPIVIDLLAPNPAQPEILINGAPGVAKDVYIADSIELSIAIPPVTDAGGINLWYGWSRYITETVSTLPDPVDPTEGIQINQRFDLAAADGGQAFYFHVIAADGLDNTSRRVYGPYLLDAPGMPDLIHMPELHGSQFASPYRGWQNNGCTLLGTDSRLTDQSLYLTWDDSLLHFVWTGADWETDGDLFIYLDTIPDQGTLAAYNPYPSTAQSTVLLLPPGGDQDNPGAGAMYADFALWAVDGGRAHLLRWDGASWIDDGPLEALGGAYAFSYESDALYTDLVLPFPRIGTPEGSMDLVAFAVDAEEGPSRGLRIWSVLPYANPVDSGRVVSNAPGAEQPHRMMLTDRYTIPLTAGTCFQPEANVAFRLESQGDGFSFNPTSDETRLLLAETGLYAEPRNLLFNPYEDAYQAWLQETYCPTNPTFVGCLAQTKTPALLRALEIFQRNGLIDSRHRPLVPGAAVSYTLSFVNPTAQTISLPAYLYSNGDRGNPQAGVTFQNMPWVDGCPGWLELALPPGSGTLRFAGNVGGDGVNSVTLDIAPSYQRNGCAVSGDVDADPAHRLFVEYTSDDGAPGHIAIAPDFNASGPVSATIRGVVRDVSAVPSIEIEVNGSSFTCTDDTPLDGQWACAWDIVAVNGGETPAHGDVFTLRARATDIFGQQGAWSAPREVIIDTQAPEIRLADSMMAFAQQDGSPPPLVSDTILPLVGEFSDSAPVRTVEVCLPDSEECELADLRPAPLRIPPSVYTYSDRPDAPLRVDGALNNGGICPANAVGLIRTFQIGESFTIAGIEVGLRLAHPYRSDLAAILTAPSGDQITLFDFDRNVLAQNVNALFSDLGTARLADDLAAHELTGSYSGNTYYPQESLSALAGQNATGNWTLTLCDRDPNRDEGAFYDATLRFTPVTPPLTFTGGWSYRADVGNEDGVLFTRHLFATDEYGHRSSTPLAVQVLVDNVPPVLAAIQPVTSMLINTDQQVVGGSVQDGGGVQALWVAVTDPLGRLSTEAVDVADSGWAYTLTPSLGGVYRIVAYAADEAGNQVSTETYAVSVLRPPRISYQVAPETDVQAGGLVTYTLQAVNPNLDAVADDVRLSISMSEWLAPVETAGATATGGALTWPTIQLAPGESVSYTVLARLTDNLMITSTITGTLPITDWVNLNGVAITSQAAVETGNLGRQESYPASFMIRNIHTQPESALENEPFVGEELAGEEVPGSSTPTPPSEEEVATEELEPEPTPTAMSTPTLESTPTPSAPPAQEGGLIGEQSFVLDGPGAAVNGVTLAREGPFIAAGVADGTVQIWQGDTPVLSLQYHEGPVNSVAWGPELEFLASASDDGLALVWEWQAEEPIRYLQGSGAPVNDVAWHPQEGALLATGDDDGMIFVWAWEEEEIIGELEGHAAPVNDLAWSPSGELLASASDDGLVVVWDWQAQSDLFILEGHNEPVQSVSWSADGRFIASASASAVNIWDAESGQNVAGFGNDNGGHNSVAWSPDPTVLAVGTGNGDVVLISYVDGRITSSILEGDGTPINSVAWSPNDSILAAGAEDGTVRLWGVAGFE